MKLIEILKSNLTPIQKECYPAVKWLFSETQKRTGRTHLLAVILIETALENPYKPIAYRDHYPAKDADEILRRDIRDILLEMRAEEQFKEIISGFKFERHCLMYIPPEIKPNKYIFKF